MITGLRPYSDMKDSGVPWLGNIPTHWDLVKMKYLFSERKEKGFPNEPLLAATQTKGVVPKDQYENRTVMALKDLHLLKLVERGDYVISLRSFQGGIEYAHFRGIISPAYTILKPSARVQRGFFEPFLKSHGLLSSLSLCVTGIREGQNIDYVRLSRMPTPVPPVEEQLAIGRFLRVKLGKINQVIRAKRRLIELLNEQKQAIIQRAVTRSLDPNVHLKPSGIAWLGKTPADWGTTPLKHLFREVDERSATGSEVLLSLRMHRGLVPHNEVSKTPISSSALVGFKQVTPGQVVMNRMRASIGMFGAVRQAGIVSPDYAVFKPRGGISPAYFVHLFKTPTACTIFRSESKGLGTGSSGFMRLYSDRFGRIKVPLPPLNEQTAIVQFISKETAELDRLADRTNRAILALREYRTRLIADVVTGRLDVREVELPALEESEKDLTAEEDATGDAVESDEEMETTEEHMDVAD